MDSIISQILLNNFSNFSCETSENTFSFIYHDQIYLTNKFYADLISPTLRTLHSIDSSISSYFIDTELNGDFNNILNIFNIKLSELSKGDIRFIITILCLLGNLFDSSFFQEFSDEQIDFNNVFDRLDQKTVLNMSNDEEINFLANNFLELYENYFHELERMEIQTIIDIFNSDNFVVSDENTLFDCIFNLYEMSKDYAVLFEFIVFLNLSENNMQKFINTFSFNDLNLKIWNNICFSLINQKTVPLALINMKYRNRYNAYRDEFDAFNGIIHQLIKLHGEDLCNKAIIDITSSTWITDDEPANVIKYDSDELFCSENLPGQWICFNFIKNKLKIKGYTLQTYSFKENGPHLKNWVLEGSNDNVTWKQLDLQCTQELNGQNKYVKYHVQNNEAYQFIRLKQTGVNWANDNILILQAIEFFGELLQI